MTRILGLLLITMLASSASAEDVPKAGPLTELQTQINALADRVVRLEQVAGAARRTRLLSTCAAGLPQALTLGTGESFRVTDVVLSATGPGGAELRISVDGRLVLPLDILSLTTLSHSFTSPLTVQGPATVEVATPFGCAVVSGTLLP
jgi:hypothetical protein